MTSNIGQSFWIYLWIAKYANKGDLENCSRHDEPLILINHHDINIFQGWRFRADEPSTFIYQLLYRHCEIYKAWSTLNYKFRPLDLQIFQNGYGLCLKTISCSCYADQKRKILISLAESVRLELLSKPIVVNTYFPILTLLLVCDVYTEPMSQTVKYAV